MSACLCRSVEADSRSIRRLSLGRRSAVLDLGHAPSEAGLAHAATHSVAPAARVFSPALPPIRAARLPAPSPHRRALLRCLRDHTPLKVHTGGRHIHHQLGGRIRALCHSHAHTHAAVEPDCTRRPDSLVEAAARSCADHMRSPLVGGVHYDLAVWEIRPGRRHCVVVGNDSLAHKAWNSGRILVPAERASPLMRQTHRGPDLDATL